MRDKMTGNIKTYSFDVEVIFTDGRSIMAYTRTEAIKKLKKEYMEEFGKDVKIKYELFDINFAG